MVLCNDQMWYLLKTGLPLNLVSSLVLLFLLWEIEFSFRQFGPTASLFKQQQLGLCVIQISHDH